LTFLPRIPKLTLSGCVQKPSKHLLNLGCGDRFHHAWLNIDLVRSGPGVIVHDLTQGIPLPDASCAAAYHSHVLEHIRRSEVNRFLSECHRVLEPGGIIRVAVPDLEQICRLYLEKLELALRGDKAAAADYDWIVLELYEQAVRERGHSEMWAVKQNQALVNREFIEGRIGLLSVPPTASRFQVAVWNAGRALLDRLEWLKPVRALRIGYFRLRGINHQWMYDRYSLGNLLEGAGFESPIQQTATSSLIPNWREYQLDADPDGKAHKPDSLFMEAIKPR
jgi:SAM-dependent methyltransferase